MEGTANSREHLICLLVCWSSSEPWKQIKDIFGIKGRLLDSPERVFLVSMKSVLKVLRFLRSIKGKPEKVGQLFSCVPTITNLKSKIDRYVEECVQLHTTSLSLLARHELCSFKFSLPIHSSKRVCWSGPHESTHLSSQSVLDTTYRYNRISRRRKIPTTTTTTTYNKQQQQQHIINNNNI